MPTPRTPPAERLLPADLPQTCPSCGRPFSLTANYRTRRSKLGRRLHKAAFPAAFIGLPLFLYIHLWIPDHWQGGKVWVHGFTVCFIGPALLLEGISLCCSWVRTLRCHSCGWEQDFPWPRKRR